MELIPTVLSLVELLADLMEVFQPLAQRKSITMVIGSMEGMSKVCVDRDKLYEVLANLLENAIKYTPMGGYVHIEAQVLDEDRKSTRLNSSHLGISYAVFCLKKKKKRR